MKLALCLIVKGTDDEAPMLERCLSSVADHVDGVFIDVNAPKGKKPSKKVLDTAKKYGDAKATVWEDNFVKARNDNFARVPEEYDWILWLDADDTVDNPEKIKEVCAIAHKDVSGIYLKYDYAHDEYGNVTVAHYNARVVRNNGTFTWKSSFQDEDVTVHETLNEIRSVGKVMNEEVKVIHHSNDKRMDASLRRNIKLLEGMLKKTESNPDPRILFYLATHYIDAGLWKQAKVLFEQYLDMSGWAEERAQAWLYLGDIYKASGDIAKARGCYSRGNIENPDDPLPYVELGELEMMDSLWKKAISWLETAVQKKPDQTFVVLRPLEGTYRAYKLLAESYANLGPKSYEKASKWLDKAMELRPFDPELQAAREKLETLTHTKNMNEAALTLVNELKNTEETDKVTTLLDGLPASMQDSPLFHSIRNYYTEPKKWPKKSVAIVCGSSALGTWGPWSLESGIGGSEEAVIQLSKELTELGWKVTVFAIPGQRRGVIDGVEWAHYWEFSSKDEFDILVGWRDPTLFDKKFNARKTYLWLHDVIDKEELIPERLKNITKVIYVSQYHRELYPFISDEQSFPSGNGIDPAQFGLDAERDPLKVVYMSAHERGQEFLQKIWPDVVKEVPGAHLHCYYGWSGFDFVNKDNPERMEWKHRLVKEQDSLPSFTDHGKIGHNEIVKEIESAGVWAYPTAFPEVYCITAVKAQAGGAWPVYANYAALKETTQFGDKIEIEELDPNSHVGLWKEGDLEKYKQMLIKRLKNPVSDKQRKEMSRWALENMSWANTARGWHEEFEN